MVLACAGVALAQASNNPGRGQGPPEGVIPGQYIVVFDEGEVRDPTAVAREHAQGHGAEVLYTYQYALEGYAARIPAQRLDEVRNDEQVAYVEPDQTAEIARQRLPWGIDWIGADVSSTRAGNGSGGVWNVNAYIIDTGIDRTHPDLYHGTHVNFTGDGRNRDCNGHGTHVAGTVAARDNTRDVVGVAPGTPLSGVKVLGCDGVGATSGVIEGVDWVTGQEVGPDKVAGTADDNPNPAIANMSLAGGASDALDTAVKDSAASGIFYSLAAGNQGADACSYSPARAGAGTNNGIVTTAATTGSNAERWSSNYGACVDIWAPGEYIRSTRMGGGTTTMSGTSMAAPHVGGGAALYLSWNTSASPSAVESTLKTSAWASANLSKDGRSMLMEYVGYF